VNEITNTVSVDVIIPIMVQQGSVTHDQQQYLSHPYYTMDMKQQKLCSIVLALPESYVHQFLCCLLETSYYEPHKQLHVKLYTLIPKT